MQHPSHTATATNVEVWCLCAAWCDACVAYRQTFAALCAAAKAIAIWVDVEDHSDVIEPLDIEDFPTILLATTHALFLGPVMPQAGVLQNFIDHARRNELPSLPDHHAAQGLLQRLRASGIRNV